MIRNIFVKKLPLLLILLLSLGFISSANAAVPSYITEDTFDNICRKVDCHQDLSDYYHKNYYLKQFHKAAAISYYKSGNRYSIDYVFYTNAFPTSTEAKAEALKGCRKEGKNCEIFLVNNSYANADLYYKLINSTSSSSYSSSSSNNIPTNAHAIGSSWLCNTGFIKDGNSCNKVEESMDYIEELKKIKELLDSGVINEEDFEKMKQKIIDNM